MNYPRVVDEFTTIKLLQTHSIARFGDGEIKLIRGGNCVSQKADKACGEELLKILIDESPVSLTGIMNLNNPSPKDWFWDKYKTPRLTSIYSETKQYFSSFITRPDSAPWINTPEYWADVVRLWAGKRVLLVTGGRSSALRADTMPEAALVQEITGPETNAYAVIDSLEFQIRAIAGGFDTVILCLGPTATCLAWRLSKSGVHALDLGHIAIYYRRWKEGRPIDG